MHGNSHHKCLNTFFTPASIFNNLSEKKYFKKIAWKKSLHGNYAKKMLKPFSAYYVYPKTLMFVYVMHIYTYNMYKHQ